MFCSGAHGGKHEKVNHRVGSAVKGSIVEGRDKGDVAIECVSARLIKVHIQLMRKSYGVYFILGDSPTLDKSTSENEHFWNSLEVVKGIPSRDHLLVLMDANDRTGVRGIGWTNCKVMGAYVRYELNDNGERLLHTTDNKLALLNTYYAAPARGMLYAFQIPNRGKAQYRLDYILKRQVDHCADPTQEERWSAHHVVLGIIASWVASHQIARRESSRTGWVLIFQS